MTTYQQTQLATKAIKRNAKQITFSLSEQAIGVLVESEQQIEECEKALHKLKLDQSKMIGNILFDR